MNSTISYNLGNYVYFGSKKPKPEKNEEPSILIPPPDRRFLSGPRIAAIPALISGSLWFISGNLPDQDTQINHVFDQINPETMQEQVLTNESNLYSPETKRLMDSIKIPENQETAKIMSNFDKTLEKYGFKKCEIKKDGVDCTVNFKKLLAALGWTVIGVAGIPNAMNCFSTGKNTNQPTLWAGGLAWLANTPLILFTQSVASLAFADIALGMMVAGAANIVENDLKKPGEERRELQMERVTNLKTLANSLLNSEEAKKTGEEIFRMAKFIGGDIKLIAGTYKETAKQTIDYIVRKRKEAPDFFKALKKKEPDPGVKRMIAGMICQRSLFIFSSAFSSGSLPVRF